MYNLTPYVIHLYAKKWFYWGCQIYIYIKYEKTGNQFVGRIVSDLPTLTKTISIPPSYFDFSDLVDDKRDMANDELYDWIPQRVPND